MKLLELEIQNVRGIRQVILSPNGLNFAVWGPNGSGKSAVVDAIDFLLTGKITRLTGKGTGNLTLIKHGPHIDCKPQDAVVRAVIQIQDINENIEIKRCIANPNLLLCEDKFRPFIEPIFALAQRGQHVLTRREILRYITADGNTRAQEIQELLKITQIEDERKTLVKVQNDTKGDYQSTKRYLDITKKTVCETLRIERFDLETVLQAINQNRAILGVSPIDVISSTKIKTGITAPTIISNRESLNVTLITGEIEKLGQSLSEEARNKLMTYDDQLRSIIKVITDDETLLKVYSQHELIVLGLDLLDESGKCPLCDVSWERGKLHEHLSEKLASANVAEAYSKRISELSELIRSHVDLTLIRLQKIIAAAEISKSKNIDLLTTWQRNLKFLLEILKDPIKKYLVTYFTKEMFEDAVAPSGVEKAMSLLQERIQELYPEATPEQTARDTLTILEGNLKSYELANSANEVAKLSYERASIMVSAFQQARDQILKELYDSIKDRFVRLYKDLHGVDESGFDAQLKPDGAALNLDVDFYGRGVHPPHALHSEGHQDSMGLCLYLALAERLTGGVIDLLILDDVVMSVDVDHRRELCKMLTKQFPKRQFFITTHDKAWATQLKTDGLITSKSLVEFYNWKVDTGPQTNTETDFWEKIEKDMQREDVPSAAARLRRESENFFSSVCDSLQAKVRFKLNGRWELGDLSPEGISKYKQLIHSAIKSSRSWGNTIDMEKLIELDSTASQIIRRSNVEQWAINSSVHYNNWSSLSPADFRPVIQAFQDLFSLFICSHCGSILYVTESGNTLETVKCNCGQVNWNLITKS